MLSIKSPIIAGIFFAVVFLTTATVSADPITVGSLTYSSSSPTSFTLGGPGMSINGTTAPLVSSVSLLSNGLIAPGGSGSTGGSVDTQDGELALTLPVTVGGVSFSPGAYLLQLRFSSVSYTAPSQLTSGFVVVAPFSLTAGLLEGYPSSLGDDPLFSAPLTGQGITTLTFMSQPGGVYRLQSQTFLFGATAQGTTVQSIPEPASMFLLLTSFAGLARFRRKRS